MAKEKWHRVENVREFLAQVGTKRVGVHQWKNKVLHWPVCSTCGLLLLRNDATRRAANAACVTYE